MSFLKYEDVLVQVDGQSVFAQNASIDVNAPVEPVRLFNGTIHRYAPAQAPKGTLTLLTISQEVWQVFLMSLVFLNLPWLALLED